MDKGWLVVQPLLTGNVSWDWGIREFAPSGSADRFAATARIFEQALLPSPGLVALPWLNIENPFLPGHTGAGVWCGVNAQTGQADFLRALAVSMACDFYRVFRPVQKAGWIDGVVLGGGASKAACFRTLLAALFHPMPVFHPTELDLTGTRGALHAFSPSVASARATHIPSPPVRVRAAVRKGFEEYESVFERFYAQLPAARPISLSVRRKIANQEKP